MEIIQSNKLLHYSTDTNAMSYVRWAYINLLNSFQILIFCFIWIFWYNGNIWSSRTWCKIKNILNVLGKKWNISNDIWNNGFESERIKGIIFIWKVKKLENAFFREERIDSRIFLDNLMGTVSLTFSGIVLLWSKSTDRDKIWRLTTC